MTRPAALRKIRQLQQLALRAGTAEEAGTAARRAHELKQRHGVTEEELREFADVKPGRRPSAAPPPATLDSGALLAGILGRIGQDLERELRRRAGQLGRQTVRRVFR